VQAIPDREARLATIRGALDSVWMSITAKGKEPLRWRRLAGKLKKELRGGRK